MAELKEIDYYSAYQIIVNACWLHVDPCDIYDEEDEFNTQLHSNIPSPEKLLIKKQSWEALSEEAREILTTVLYATDELYDMLSTKNKGILSKRSIRMYFTKIWQSKFIVNRTIKEITTWVNQL
jgi:hypothetical protein